MEANPFYYRGRPKLDRIEYRFLPDENTQVTQARTGEIDVALACSPMGSSSWHTYPISRSSGHLRSTPATSEAGGPAARGDYGAMIYGQGITSAELNSVFACKAVAPHGFNIFRYCSPRVDARLERADTSYADAVRGKAYLEARRLIAADAPMILTIHREDVHALRAGVTGFRPNGLNVFDDVMDLDVK